MRIMLEAGRVARRTTSATTPSRDFSGIALGSESDSGVGLFSGLEYHDAYCILRSNLSLLGVYAAKGVSLGACRKVDRGQKGVLEFVVVFCDRLRSLGVQKHRHTPALVLSFLFFLLSVTMSRPTRSCYDVPEELFW